ncbi:MAG: PPC domain-containing DNA-binding protein [Planctomycetota bacterium]
MRCAEEREGHRRVLLVKLDPGEKVMESLSRLAEKRNLRGAWVEGLGAVKDVELGWFDTANKTYVKRSFPDLHELVSLTGNVGRAGAETAVHLHAVCAGRDLRPVAGHLFEAVCAVTVEMKVREFTFPLERVRNETFALNLLALPAED